ncbi:MAG TPA: hypothetical protein VFG83_08840 [Kofleriaceae bacterium]|nr:hypothetical protein [Kofleriaceae bacterium]
MNIHTTLRSGLLAAATVALFCTAVPRVARAEVTASCQVLEIKARNTDKAHIDPDLKPLQKKLKKPPFASWNTFDSLAGHKKTVVKMSPATLALVPGGKMTMLLRDRDQPPGKKPRYRLSITLDDKSGKRRLDATVKLDRGDWYLIGGESLPGAGTYILAASCK